MQLFGFDSPAPNSVTYYASGGPPTFAAEQGSLVRDVNNLLWEQRYPGLAQGWDVFSPNGANTRIIWSHETWFSSSITTTVSGGGATPTSEFGTPSNTSDYWTMFRLNNTVRVRGLVIPFSSFTGGTVTMKASIYQCHTLVVPGWPWKPVANVTFALSGYAPAPEPVLVPYSPASTAPIILTPGKYYIRHVWRNVFNGALCTRAMVDFSAAGNGNRFRTDRKRANGYNYDTMTILDELPQATMGAADSASMGIVNFGIWGEVLS